MAVIIFSIFLIFCIGGFIFFKKIKPLKIQHDTQLKETLRQIQELTNKIKILQDDISIKSNILQQKQLSEAIIDNNIKAAEKQLKNVLSQNKEQQEKYNNFLLKTQQQIKNYDATLIDIYNNLKKNYQTGYINFVKELDLAYSQKEEQFEKSSAQLKNELDQLKNELSAAAEAKRKEEQREQQLDFYKIQLTDRQIKDIELLQSWKTQLSDPSLVSKIIWSSCVMKPTSALCARLTNGKTVCGIYKITSIKDSKTYIGQSVDIASRFKQHIKCGLGIDAPATNKLYNILQQEGVYNFTYQIIEECKKEKLNERERFWIQTYQSDKFGMNGTGGNKK